MAEDDDEFLPPREAAERLQVSPKTISRWAAMGLIPYVVAPGGHRRFRPRDIEAVAQHMAENPREPQRSS